MSSKIGILIADLHRLEHWHLRIIEAALDEPALEMTLVLQERERSNRTPSRRLEKLLGKAAPNRVLFRAQRHLEHKIISAKPSVDNGQLLMRLKSIQSRTLVLKDNTGSAEAFEGLRAMQLDLLFAFDSFHLPADFAATTRYGLWSLCFGNPVEGTYGPTGFYEVARNEPSIACRLIGRSPKGVVRLVDEAFFNRSWSMVETATTAGEGSVSLVLKNLKGLGKSVGPQAPVHGEIRQVFPSSGQIFHYLVRFYSSLMGKLKIRLAYKIFGQRHECWSVFVGAGHFLETRLQGMKPLAMPKDEFWADPFLFQYRGEHFLFYENYSYTSKRGKISCGRLDGLQMVDIVDVLDLDYHLSYPYIFEENGSVYLMPETSENRRLEIYKAVDFPNKWELYTTAFEGECVADAFFFDDDQNQKWLFVNKQMNETSPMNSELFIYKVDSIELNTLQPHAQNPVIIDARVARNGGAIFKYKNEYYRPSQRNIDGVYGRALNINQIKELSLESYEEETVRIVAPDFDQNLMATHHLHQTDTLFVIDAAYRSK